METLRSALYRLREAFSPSPESEPTFDLLAEVVVDDYQGEEDRKAVFSRCLKQLKRVIEKEGSDSRQSELRGSLLLFKQAFEENLVLERINRSDGRIRPEDNFRTLSILFSKGDACDHRTLEKIEPQNESEQRLSLRVLRTIRSRSAKQRAASLPVKEIVEGLYSVPVETPRQDFLSPSLLFPFEPCSLEPVSRLLTGKLKGEDE